MSVKLLYGQSPMVAEFVAEILGKRPLQSKSKGIGVLDEEGRMIAGIVFFNWMPELRRVEVGVGSVGERPWFNRRIAKAVKRYVFDELQADQVVAHIDLSNERAARAAKLFGAKVYMIPPLEQRLLVLTRDMLNGKKRKRRRGGRQK